jgi:hypothetical protein
MVISSPKQSVGTWMRINDKAIHQTTDKYANFPTLVFILVLLYNVFCLFFPEMGRTATKSGSYVLRIPEPKTLTLGLLLFEEDIG